MPLITLIILATIQGLTEFLPISSSGHLSLLYQIFGIEDGSLMLSIILHIATLLSVVVYYRKDILPLIRNPFCKTNRKIIATTIATGVVYLICKPIIDRLFNYEYLFIFFIITAFLLFISDYVTESREILTRTRLVQTDTPVLEKTDILDMDISYRDAIIIGLVQGVATIPGISRSGSTIATSSLLGVKTDKAKYSFLISIPIIILSLIYTIISNEGLCKVNVASLIIACIICFLVGLLSIKCVRLLLKNNTLSYFGYYLLALASLLILNATVLHLF